ncbi:MAG TPA: MFS transporter [Dehalococcoidia bacterium]|nr:MFS transporter [Dehalococcoidia bacterium]
MTASVAQAEAGVTTVSSRRSPNLLIFVLGLGIFVGGFDQTFIVTILPDIIDDIDLPVSRFGLLAWIINGYLIGYMVAMPLMGRLADIFGRVRVYLMALALFAGGSVGIALADGLWWIVFFRGVTAIGGGALVPIAMAIAADTLEQERRPLAIGSLSSLDDTSSLLGPLWGAVIATALGWRWLFWLNIVFVIPIAIAVPLLARDQPRGLRRPPVDWVGGLTLTLGLTLLAVGLTDNGGDPRPLAITLVLIASGLALGGVFVRHELRTSHPLIDLRLFREVPVAVANVTYFLTGGALITVMINVPLLTNVLWGGDALDGGLNLMRMMVFMPIGGLVGGYLAIRIGYRATAVVGFAGAALALVFMRAWPESPSSIELWIPLAVAGLCFTLDDAPIVATVLDRASVAHRAASAALLQVVQTLGMIVGTALLATQGLGRFNERASEIFAEQQFEASDEAYQAAIHSTFEETFLVAAIVMAIAAGLGLYLRGGRAQRFRLGSLFGVRGASE